MEGKKTDSYSPRRTLLLLREKERVRGKQVHPYLSRQEMAFDMSEGQNSLTDCFTITALINTGAVVK